MSIVAHPNDQMEPKGVLGDSDIPNRPPAELTDTLTRENGGPTVQNEARIPFSEGQTALKENGG